MTIKELKEIQERAIKNNNTANLIIKIILISLLIITILIALIFKINIFFIIFPLTFEFVFILAPCLIIKSIIVNKDAGIFNQEFKRIFVIETLKKVFDNLNYDSQKGISEETIRNTNMMNLGDSYHSNDYISGTYKNVAFEQSDIHIQEKHEEKDKDGNTRTYWVTTFKGRWMIFDFNKKFIANIQIASKGFYGNYLVSKNYTKVNMEDIEFNKLYNVYTSNEHEAFYIITPSFIEKLKKIINSLNCNIMFCFINNKLHIAINNYQDSFEHNILKPINEEEIKENIIKDIKLITDFINELELNNTIFKED